MTGEGNTLYGYAAKFDEPSEDLGGFVEVIRPGAFTSTLATADVRALYNHNHDHVLGRTKSGTLRLEEDEVGLRFEVDLPDIQVARDLKVSVSRGDIDGCSFGFYCVADELHAPEGDDDLPIREVLEVELIEISPAVAFPAYPSTEVDLRSLNEFRAKQKVVEEKSKTPKLDRAKRILASI